MFLLGVWAAMAVSAASPAAGSYEDIHIGTVAVRIPIPAGFCKPTGDDSEVMQRLAAGDQENTTHLSLIECKPTAKDRYYLLKTPTDALNETIDRAEAIKGLSAAVETPEFVDKLNGEISQKVGEEKSRATGTRTEIGSKLAPRGHDDVCVYMGGLMTTTAGDQSQTQSIGSCMTVVGNRLISITLYENSSDPAEYKRILPELKALAMRIAPSGR